MKAYRLSDQNVFQTLNGLWTGKKEPLVEACVLRNTNFGPDGILDPSDVAKLQVEKRQLEKRQLERGDIILERSGGSPKQPVGRVAFFDLVSNKPFSFSNFTSALRIIDRSLFEPRFVHYFLLDFYFEGGTKPLQSNTTGLRNLNFDSYLQTEVPCPSLDEQRKIAAVLGKVQAAVAVEGDLVRVARELKQAALRQLFTRGLRNEPQKQTEIGLVPESWDVVPLGNHLKLAQYGLSVKGQPSGACPILRMNCQLDGKVVFRNLQFVDLESKLLDAFRLRDGDLVFNRTNSPELVGRTALFRSDREAVFASYLIRLTLDEEVWVPEFVNYFMNIESTQAEVKKLATRGVSQANINATKLKGFLIPKTAPAEQSEIAAMLATLDAKIAHHEARQALLRELFRTLLHDLLTARRRVTGLDLDHFADVSKMIPPTP